MKRNRSWFFTDVSFVLLLLLLFLCVLFFIVVPQRPSLSIAALTAVFAAMIVTHYTSLTVGLILDIVLMLVYSSYLLYQAVWVGAPVTIASYFWLLVLIPITLATDGTFTATRRVIRENDALTKQASQVVGWDAETGLRNATSYTRIYPIFSRLAGGCGQSVTLVVWEFRYEGELKRILGANDLHAVARQLSTSLDEQFGDADVMFLFSESPYLWGALFVTELDNMDSITQQVHAAKDIPLPGYLKKKLPKLEMRVGSASAEPGESADTLLKKARANMQYDV